MPSSETDHEEWAFAEGEDLVTCNFCEKEYDLNEDWLCPHCGA